MLNVMWNIMGITGVLVYIISLVILIHCYFATKDVYKQAKQLNDKYGKGE